MEIGDLSGNWTVQVVVALLCVGSCSLVCQLAGVTA